MDGAHPGAHPWERSFLSVAPQSVSVLALKKAEDGTGIIIRLQEMQGRRTTARVVLPHIGLNWRSAIGPWEVRSFIVAEVDGRAVVREVDLLEQELEGTS
jgi:hypothetical protein